jgi:MFS family permease
LEPNEAASGDTVASVGGSPALERRISASSVRQYGLRALAILFILNAIDEFDRAVLAVALDDIREDFGVSDAVAGLLPLAVIFITGILALPAGNLADRWSRRNILVIGAVVWGSAGILASISRSFAQLFFTRALLGVGQATIGPTHLSLLSDYYPVGVRGRVMNFWRSANPFGQIIGAIVGGAIIASAGWRWAFLAAAIPGLLVGLFALTLREPKRGEADLATAIDGNPMLAEFMRDPDTKSGFFESLSTIFGIRTLRYLIFANAAIGFVLIGIVFWFPALFERKYDFSTQEAGAAFGALALSAFVGQLLAGSFIDARLPRGFSYLTRLGAASVVLLAATWVIGFAIPIAPVSLFFICGGAFLASIGSGGFIPAVAACSPPRIRSQSFAAFGLSLAVFGAAAAPVAVGAVSELFQYQFDMNDGDSLRYAIITLASTVSLLGAWLVYQASRSANADVQRVVNDFIAEHTWAQQRDADGR